MSTAMSSSSPLEDRLAEVLRTWQLPVSVDCQSLLDGLIQQAASRAHAEGVAFDDAKLSEADANFRKLLTEMTRQAGALGFQELRETTFINALARLCPIWPFC